jgi:RHS repeat-associated protein
MPNDWSVFTAGGYPRKQTLTKLFDVRNVVEPLYSMICEGSESSEITGPAWALSVGFSPTTCFSSGYRSPTIKMNGCELILIAEGEQGALGHCKGKKMVVESPHECAIEIPEQIFGKGVRYNRGGLVDFDPEVQYKSSAECHSSKGVPIEFELEVPSWERTVREPIWMPTVQTGPVAADTVTFQWEGVNGKIEPVEELAPPPPGVSCTPELKRGCRALTFKYAKETTAKGEGPEEWGEYSGNLTYVYLTAWSPSSEKMQTQTVAQYAYDSKGRLRAEWDPQISPALKSTYAYDSEGHVVALTAPGQQPWLMHYGALGEDPNTGRLLSVMRPPASKAFGNGQAPVNSAAPTLSSSSPKVGVEIKVSSNGTWSNSPLTYTYQWERCEAGGAKCAPIAGAVNAGYYPVTADEGHALEALVTATNGAGAVSQSSAATGTVATGTPSESAPTPPAAEGNSITTIDYAVPVSGASAPNQLGEKEVEAWAQKDDPLEAAAIFPPDEPMGWPAKDYKRASIRYLDSHARAVNEAMPSGGITTSEYNENNDVVRSLDALNRSAALKEGSKSTEDSQHWATESSYNAEGTQLESTLGPEHLIKLTSGKTAQARIHTVYSYNEGAPSEGGPYHLVTKVSQGAEISGEAEQEARTTSYSYSGQENLGWKLRKPTSTTADPSGLKSTHTTVFNPTTGEIEEARTPGSSGEGSAHDTVSIYYTAEANSTYPECGGHAEWTGLPCKTLPGAQPKTEGLPELSSTTIESYDLLDEPTKSTQKSGSNTRTTTTSYEESGRPTSTQTTSTSGSALPAVKDRYSEQTGALIEESEVLEGKTIALKGTLNSLGQLESYTDATGNVTSYSYDIDGRPTEVNDGRGTQKYVYSATTGLETEMTDSAAGTFKATYDAEGNMASQSLPNGMTATYTRNKAGMPISLTYVKTTHCTENCTWFSDSVVPTAHGQWATQSSSLSSDAYSYDSLGRLTQVQDTPASKGCAVRVYGYDLETNRTSLTSREPGSKGECATEGGTVESHSYDEGNRLTDAGAAYDSFGDLTKLSALDAGGSEMTSSYYVDGQTASMTQNGETIGYTLDPEGRQSEAVLTGKTANVLISHYPGPGASPSWTTEASGKWSRNIQGIGGGLIAVQADGETPVLQISNLHGDIVATAADEETATKLLSSADTTEFGVPTTGAPARYSWLGTQEEPTELPSGATAMGVRTYVPQLGRFMQPDPVPGGTSNPYAYTSGDPLGETDLTGKYDMVLSATIVSALDQESMQEAEQRAAEEAAARAQAEREAAEAAAEAAAYAGMMEAWGSEEGWGEEEEYEEEGEYGSEYISNHSSPGREEARTEPGLVEQPLGEEDSEGQLLMVKGGPGVGCEVSKRCKRIKAEKQKPKYNVRLRAKNGSWTEFLNTYCGIVGGAALTPGVDVFGAPLEVGCAGYGAYKAVEAIVEAL